MPILSPGIHAVTIGTGAPLIALHGGPGLDHSYLRPSLDLLADAARVTFIDLRGNGRSERPLDYTSITHASLVADVETVRRSIGAERIDLFGHSYGGCIALEYALAHGDRLASLVLCSTMPVLDYPAVIMDNAARRASESSMSALLRGLSSPPDDDAAFEQLWLAILPLYFHRFERGQHDALFARTLFSAAAYARANLGTLPSFDVAGRLGEIEIPTLILAGADDWIAPAEQTAERLHAGIRGSRLERFADSGHFPFIEEPERFLSVMREWLVRGRA